MADKFHTVVAATLLMVAAVAHAQSRFEEDFDDKDKPWQEIAVQLPAAPQPGDLVPFYVSATATQSFAIDTRSVSVGQDGVIRYTLAAVSDAGAKNISYEGIRCATYERKLYAFGRNDGSWSRSHRDQWERIQSNAANRQHAALTKDFFCVEKTVAGSAEDIVQRLRQGQTLAPQSNR
ncbi:CNP1-like family protein [Noviherbaspirillum sp. ST9]|uniref:CNP1-like family protein n=1 Tax=Noviherbaspirillum sp. ST9 TaxID=3401606 RepID=UPI003B587C57